MLRAVVPLLFVVACSFSASFDDGAAGAPTVAFESAETGSDELVGTVAIPVVLSHAADTQIAVDYVVADTATATRDIDFSITTGALVFEPGEVRKEIAVTINPDSDETEADESFDIVLAAPVGAVLDDLRAVHSVRISDHILPRATVAATSESSEDQPSSLTILLDRPAEPGSSVTVGVAGGMPVAASADDLDLVDGTQVAIPEGAMMVSVPIGENDDNLDEEDREVVELTLRGASSNIVIGAARKLAHSILDDDAPPLVRFANASSSITETGTGTTTQPMVTLSAPSGRVVRVNYSRDGSDSAAASDATVMGSPGTLTFQPGDTSELLTVNVANDIVDEDDEDVRINLSSPVNATLGTPSSHTLTIKDNDTSAVSFAAASSMVDEDNNGGVLVRVRLTTPSSKTVSVQFTVSGTSTAESGDYEIVTASPLVFQPGTTQLDIVVDIPDNTPASEGNETLVLDIGTITNAQPGSTLRHTVTITE